VRKSEGQALVEKEYNISLEQRISGSNQIPQILKHMNESSYSMLEEDSQVIRLGIAKHGCRRRDPPATIVNASPP
jgi:hypothetical protein